METQSAYDGNIRHQHGEGGDDLHQEKQSVLRKVTAKAKKIKDTIKKHSPGHHHDHGNDEYREGQIPDDHDVDEEDDNGEEEIVQNPEVHGAPLNESAAAKKVVYGQPADLSRPGITNVETSKPLPTDLIASRERSENYNIGNYETKHNDPPNSADSGLEAPLVGEQPRVDFGKTTDTVEEPLAPMYKSAAAKNVVSDQPEDLSRPGITNFETSKALPTDPLASRERSENYNTGNYETKQHNPPNSTVSGLEAPLVGEQPRVDFGKTTDTVEEPLAPMNDSTASKNVLSGQPEELSRPEITNFEASKALPTDPLASRERSENYYTGNYETTHIDPSNVVSGLEAPLVRDQPRVDFGKTTDTVEEPLGSMNDSAAAKNAVSGQPDDLSRLGITSFETSKALPTDPLASRKRSENYYTGNYETKHNDPLNNAVSGLEAPLVKDQPRVDIGGTTDTVEEPLAPTYESAGAKNAVFGQSEDLSRPGITNFKTPKALPTDPLPSGERSENYYTGNYETKHDPLNSAVSGLDAPQGREQPRVDFGKTADTVEEPLAPQKHSSSFKLSKQQKVNLQRPKGLDEDDAVPKDTFDAYTEKGGEATGIAPILHSIDKMKIYDEHDTGREQNLPSATQPKSSELSFPTGTHDQFSPEPTRPLGTVPTPQEHTHNVDKPSNRGSYTEKISSATSAAVDKAVPDKNIVASKLGYDEKDQAQCQSPNESREGQNTTKQESAIDYGKTDKPSPVYEEAAGAGTTVMPKVHGPGSGTATGVETEKVQDQDKGESQSVKSYIAEKFKPGDEDRALSEVLSEALQKRSEDSPEAEKETRASVKVTESKEVATPEKTSPTQSMVDKLKGAVGSWFGKGEGNQRTQQTHGSSYDTTGSSASADGRTLQESGN
ncbi:Pentatricopeptide repeat (PPR) superfamily protein [Hibiscus syriacus]|uniref:Pentatricopeptide repeat (PPR) superfamily protein n=1 Tax=Hibiscus syriacus TaxID=106335 RepID=A0A6A3AJD3_HIBSY|nr:Pentatricopeptide repeat (PPR) superfamily protein [Hibiscus syriacus]